MLRYKASRFGTYSLIWQLVVNFAFELMQVWVRNEPRDSGEHPMPVDWCWAGGEGVRPKGSLLP